MSAGGEKGIIINMSKIYFALSFSAIALVLGLFTLCESCQSRTRNYVANFERFVMKVEQNAEFYSKDDWKKADETFKKFKQEKLNRENSGLNFSSEEQNKIGKLEARYYKVRVASVGKGLIEEVEGDLEYLKGFAEEVLNEL